MDCQEANFTFLSSCEEKRRCGIHISARRNDLLFRWSLQLHLGLFASRLLHFSCWVFSAQPNETMLHIAQMIIIRIDFVSS
jgi:hypothetical protein